MSRKAAVDEQIGGSASRLSIDRKRGSMPSWVDEQIARQRYQDLVREEQLRQLASLVLVERARAPRFYGPLLVGLGRRMMLWGCQLESRYSAIATNTGRPISGC